MIFLQSVFHGSQPRFLFVRRERGGICNVVGQPGKPVIGMHVSAQVARYEQASHREIFGAFCFLAGHEWCNGREREGSVGEDGNLGQRRMPTDKTLSYSADLVKRYDRDRFLTAMFAPERARDQLLTLYAFNVEIARIRETVTEPMIGQMRLQWWRDVLTAIAAGDGPPKGHPVAEPLAALIQVQSLPLDPFLALLEAREQDLSDDPPATMNDLVRYCRGSSAGLAVLGVKVIGVDDEVSCETAESIATAWALAGIARAVRFLALAGRVMLPTAAMSNQGLALQDLQNPETAKPVADIVSEVCNLARDHLAKARENRNTVDLKGLPIFLPATLADSYLDMFARAEYQIFDSRVIRQRPNVARLWWSNWRKRY